jgi:hypothetical protein
VEPSNVSGALMYAGDGSVIRAVGARFVSVNV